MFVAVFCQDILHEKTNIHVLQWHKNKGQIHDKKKQQELWKNVQGQCPSGAR